MGVGVLIGRSGSSKPSSARRRVVAVAPSGGSTGGTGAASETFTDDWPSGTHGLHRAAADAARTGTSTSAVEAAKTAATAKGAKGVGALKSEEFSSLSGSGYVIYSGVYHKHAAGPEGARGPEEELPRREGDPGLERLRRVQLGRRRSVGRSSGGHGVEHHRIRRRRPCSKASKGAKGKSYEEKSKNLPDVVSTG